MSKLYTYYILNTDGTEDSLCRATKMSLTELQGLLGGSIQLVPRIYYNHHHWGPDTVVYVNESMRLTNPVTATNPFFRNLGQDFNVIGRAVRELEVDDSLATQHNVIEE